MDNGIKLKQALDVSEVLSEGAEFHVDKESLGDYYGEELFFEGDYSSADEDEENITQQATPWNGSFDELRKEMQPISQLIYKRITKEGTGKWQSNNIRVTIEYNAFNEHELRPFDSSKLRKVPCRFILGAGDVLPGLDQAVQTMLVGEEAEFLISYKLLYGEVGCPPRIKPKADGLFVIKLISFVELETNVACANEPDPTERRSYVTAKETVAEIRKVAKESFQRGMLPNAIEKYKAAVNILHKCQLKDDAEQKEQEETLIALYTSLAVCYNRRQQPKAACNAVNEIRRLCDINQNAKALYQEGKALLKLGDYNKARVCLKRAKQLMPGDENIEATLKELHINTEKYRQEEKSIWTRAMGMATKKQEQSVDELKKFTDSVRGTINMFIGDAKCTTLPLPEHLSEQEIRILHELADEYKLKLTSYLNGNEKQYKFTK
ncbi:AGAP011458-PA-like protein [Anopheles sinensis]|uniref:peptidylprolyl isomerase n=1 Tax=Anopheles sinensis TaxID=74873 RepID=A0A084VU23_ANOSI|nr:AGAP011458-PA-like protein [Anopheles sinensis]